MTGGRGVELILDAVGGASFQRGYRLLAPTGRMGMFGVSSAATNKTGGMFGMMTMLASTPWLQFNPLPLINPNKGVFGVNLGHMWDEIDRMGGWADRLAGLWEQGAIKPKIARTFGFSDAAAAHHFIQDRQNVGKVLLTPSGAPAGARLPLPLGRRPYGCCERSWWQA
jgi:synaptic vesicle membrane protein VAT-1